MSGKTAANKLSINHVQAKRSGSYILIAVLYAAVVTLILFSLLLVLSNVDQLFPHKPAGDTNLMQQWRTDDTHVGVFAGGFWKSATFWRSMNITVVTATITTLIAAVLGIPASYALARYRVPGRSLIDILFSSVIVLPSSSIGLCLIVALQYSPLYPLQKSLGIIIPYSLGGIIIVQLVLSLAMGISAWKAAFAGVNPRFEHVARSLGSSPWRAFRTVTLPNAKAGIIAGLVIAWTRAAAEFGGVLIFCSTFAERPAQSFPPFIRTLQLHKADILPVMMWSQIEYGNLEFGFAIGFALVVISAASVFAIHKLGGKTYIW